MRHGDHGDRGPITRADFIARADQRFDRMDSNHDGVVTADEIGSMGGGRRGMAPRGTDAPPPADDANAPPPPPPPGNDGSMPPPPRPDDGGPPPPGGRGGPGGHFAQRMFDRLDANHDGQLTRDEVRADAAARFDAADTNHDGVLDENEQSAMRDQARDHMQAMRERWRGREGGDDNGAPPPPQPDPNSNQ
jgi:hypothetical protein